jgi:hypothetical protein
MDTVGARPAVQKGRQVPPRNVDPDETVKMARKILA